MVNDPRDFTIEGKQVDCEGLSETPTKESIADYIRIHEISPIAVSLVYAEAVHDQTPPTEQGTLRNLYNMYMVLFNNGGDR